jgi:uncharacterized membrane protein
LAVSKLNRKILIPAVALIALMVKEIGGIELSDAQINVIVEGILGVTAIVGIFMNPKAPPSPTDAEQEHASTLSRGVDADE